MLVAGSNWGAPARCRRTDRWRFESTGRRRAALADGLVEDMAEQILIVAGRYSHILASGSAFGQNILPRIAAKRDVAQISDHQGRFPGHIRAPELSQQRNWGSAIDRQREGRHPELHRL